MPAGSFLPQAASAMARRAETGSVPSKTQSRGRYSRRRGFPYFRETFDERMRADRVVQGEQSSHLVEVEAMHEAAVIDDDEWIVDRPGRWIGLLNASRVSVSTQQTQYPRTVAIHGPGIVKHDLQAVAPACEQKLPQHFEAAGGVVFLSQRVIENADSARGFLQDRVDCRFVFGIAEDRRVLRVGFVCHRSQPAGPDLDKQI